MGMRSILSSFHCFSSFFEKISNHSFALPPRYIPLESSPTFRKIPHSLPPPASSTYPFTYNKTTNNPSRLFPDFRKSIQPTNQYRNNARHPPHRTHRPLRRHPRSRLRSSNEHRAEE